MLIPHPPGAWCAEERRGFVGAKLNYQRLNEHKMKMGLNKASNSVF